LTWVKVPESTGCESVPADTRRGERAGAAGCPAAPQ